MNVSTLNNKRVLVVGLGVSGSSVVRFLHRHNIAFDVVDEKSTPASELKTCMNESRMHTELSESLCCAYDVLVLSPGIPRALPAITAALNAGVDVIGDVELFASAVGDTPVFAVTGSNGKSTVVSWLAHVLQACGKRVQLCGNIGTPALDSISPGADCYVLELSSYQLESTSSLAAFAATVLNVSDDHLDRYDSIEHYAEVKRRVYLNAVNAVFNRDDYRTHPTAMQGAGAEQGSTSLQSETCFAISQPDASDYQLRRAANEEWLSHGDTSLVEKSRLLIPGNHNVANALAVLALLEPLALDNDAVIAALLSFTGLEHRTEFVRERNGVRWYNDSKGTNIDACEKAIIAMNAPVVLIAGGLGKGANFNALRSVVEVHVKAAVLIGEDAPVIEQALNGTCPIHRVNSLDDAVRLCAELANNGDAVLLSPACSSFDMFENFEQRGRYFKKAVEALVA